MGNEQVSSGVVADGRTIHSPGRRYYPGETFTASPDEIARLTALGYLRSSRHKLVEKPDGTKLLFRGPIRPR